jgi:hypothetical protein
VERFRPLRTIVLPPSGIILLRRMPRKGGGTLPRRFLSSWTKCFETWKRTSNKAPRLHR